MTPRLNRQARQHLAHASLHGKRRGFRVWRAASRPSPAEKRKARHLSFSQAKSRIRKQKESALLRLMISTYMDDKDDPRDILLGIEPALWPESRGTTSQQLTVMHLEAEGIDVPRPGIL